MNSNNSSMDWLKFFSFMVAVVVYMYATFRGDGNILYLIYLLATAAGILMYSTGVNLSIYLFYIAIIANSGIGKISITPDLVVCTIGFIVWMVINNRMKKKEAIKPFKLQKSFRFILWGLVITTILAVANASIQLNTGTLNILTSMYIVIPTLVTLTSVLGLMDMYLMRLVEQGILLYIYYMQMSLGEFDSINILMSVLMIVIIMVGYIDYIYYKNIKKVK